LSVAAPHTIPHPLSVAAPWLVAGTCGYRICCQSNHAKDEMKRTMDNIDEESIKDLRLAGSFLATDPTSQPIMM